MLRTIIVLSVSFCVLVTSFVLILQKSYADGKIQGTGDEGAFTGTFSYTATDDNDATLTINLTNSSPAGNGGYLTGFAFNDPLGDITGVSLSSSDSNFGLLGGPAYQNNIDGTPYGQFDIGASVGGGLRGVGNPTNGLGVGDSAGFTFTLTGTGLGGLNSDSFKNEPSAGPGNGSGSQPLVVNFQNFNDGGTDIVPVETKDDAPTPEPSTMLLFAFGLVGLFLRFKMGKLAVARVAA